MDILFLLFIIFVVIVIGAVCFLLCHMVWNRFCANKSSTTSSQETQLSQPPPSPLSLSTCNLQTNQRTSSQHLCNSSMSLLLASNNVSDVNYYNSTSPCSERPYTTCAIMPSSELSVRVPLENNQLVRTAIDDQPPSYQEATGIK